MISSPTRFNSNGWRMRVCAALALVFIAGAMPACSMFDKDEVLPDEAADKLYNEGLYLLNEKT